MERQMSRKQYEDFYKAFSFFVSEFDVRKSGITRNRPNRVWFRKFFKKKDGNFVLLSGGFVLKSTQILYNIFDVMKHQSIEAGTTESTMYEAMKRAHANMQHFVNSLE